MKFSRWLPKAFYQSLTVVLSNAIYHYKVTMDIKLGLIYVNKHLPPIPFPLGSHQRQSIHISSQLSR